MGYPKQSSTLSRLYYETLSALDRVQETGKNQVMKTWMSIRRDLMAHIAEAYRHCSRKETWTANELRPFLPYLRSRLRGSLEQFQAQGVALAKKAFNDTYNEAMLRHAWMLDMVTPPSYKIAIPKHRILHESAIEVGVAVSKYGQDWVSRWSQWSDAWEDALSHNLMLGAMNQSSIRDAMDEVDATRAGTPSKPLWNAIDGIMNYENLAAVSSAASDLADLNGDSVDEEVWKTRGDLRVCDDCSELDGTPIDEDDAYPPLHPNCNCYTLVVPRSYVELLRSGDDADRKLARDMMAQGLVPNSLVIRGDDGKIAAQAIVDFGKWKSGQGFAVRSE